MMRFHLNLRRVLVLLLIVGVVTVGGLWGSHAWVRAVSSGRCLADTALLPQVDVALVLGCSPKIGSRPNMFYENRMEAAAALYRAGRVKALIVSGDNSTHQYDEPTAMKESLIALGVPAERIYCDYAGFRTLDSVVRAEAIFGQARFIIVSQRFHNERAVFLAQHHGLEAWGYNAQDVSHSIGLMTHLREYLARVNAVLGVTLLQTRPKFDGPKVEIHSERWGS